MDQETTPTQPTEGLTREEQKFVDRVRLEKAVDFPRIARDVGLTFSVHLLPKLKVEGPLRTAVKEALVELKYELLQLSLSVAKVGRKTYGASPDPASIKMIVGLIDSGALLGEAQEAPEDDSNMQEHIARLGLGD